MAALSALDAFSIDAMIPALEQISIDLSIAVENQRQWIITALFLGFSVGVLFYGFVADRVGRRTPIIAGIIIFLMGTLACIAADSLITLLIGRSLQGLGAAGPYVLSMTLVRDQFSGRDMAQMLSLIMMVFIGVPMIAPFVGQGVMMLAGWQAIFGVLAVYAVVLLIWFCNRQPETLTDENRKPLTIAVVGRSIGEVLSNSQSCRYLLAMAAVFSAFMVYLTTAQQVFQNMYSLGHWFPLVFASLASVFGIGSYLNSRWVIKMGSARLIHWALLSLVVTASGYLLIGTFIDDLLPLPVHLLFVATIMFCMALLFGNTMSMAMEPMGHIAGSASSVINSLSTLIAIVVASLFGAQLQDNASPLAVAFLVMGGIAIALNWPNLREAQVDEID